ncbi:Uncharacterised protein [Vibrio cholerae]|nr:Uncharacterised protein [Vibrio cholerae]
MVNLQPPKVQMALPIIRLIPAQVAILGSLHKVSLWYGARLA